MTTTATAPVTVAWLSRDSGWGALVKVTVADTPEADAAAAAFFRRSSTVATGHAAYVDEEASEALGAAMADVFFPVCEHGMSAALCAGPGHYPADDPADDYPVNPLAEAHAEAMQLGLPCPFDCCEAA